MPDLFSSVSSRHFWFRQRVEKRRPGVRKPTTSTGARANDNIYKTLHFRNVPPEFSFLCLALALMNESGQRHTRMRQGVLNRIERAQPLVHSTVPADRCASEIRGNVFPFHTTLTLLWPA